MSADVLLFAAQEMREDWGGEGVSTAKSEFVLAVAEWLEYVGYQGDRAAINHRARALAAAAAYLGDDE